MKNYLTRFVEAFLKQEYELAKISIEIKVNEAEGDDLAKLKHEIKNSTSYEE